MIEQTHRNLADSIKGRVWIISDLQQSDPLKAEKCLSMAIEDFKNLDLKCDRIWYLGDSVEGDDIGRINEMVQMQDEKFSELNIPLCYVCGNHDFDYFDYAKQVHIPFYEAVKKHADWKCIDTYEDFYFWDSICGFDVLFISDHCALDGSWSVRMGDIQGKARKYPHKGHAIEELKTEMAMKDNNILTASHYSFPGGNRASNFLKGFLPLPSNVRMHFYGHAHIGDRVWAGKDWGRKISCVNDHEIVQVNVSSLEYGRGSAVRSVFLEIYDDDNVGVFFRNHSTCEFTECFMQKL